MFYQEYQPRDDLADHIQVIWAMESEKEDDHFPREKILPDGIVELVIHYRAPFITHRSDGSSYVQPPSFAISQMKQFIEIESNGAIGFIAARFFPWGAHHFFDEPIRNFLDGIVDTATLWKASQGELVQQIATADGHQDRVRILERFLLDQLQNHARPDRTVDHAIKLCRERRGQLRIDELCELVNLSKKQLERQFLKTIGTTPKTFCRVSRFLDVCHHLRNYRDRTMIELTHDCGYFDQAHFIKDFKAFSGFTPRQFFDREDIGFADF